MSGAAEHCGILLAAGRSTRFGGDKLLYPLADGTPLALASAWSLQAALPRVVAVVDTRNCPLRTLLAAAGIEIVAAPLADAGMGTSLASGVAATRDATGWIVALADMPFISPATVARVHAALLAGAPLAAPAYEGRRGHPVGFAARFRENLLTLRGDAGARHLLHEQREMLALLACDDPGVLRDIDTPEDLVAFQHQSPVI